MERICRGCGATFECKTSNVRRGQGLYCTYACFGRSHQEPVNIARRFWAKVQESNPNECWPWTGLLNAKGYGRFCVGGNVVLAHRYAYELANGVVTPDLCVCHSCDYPACCNPAHLWVGSKADNNADMASKGRRAKHYHCVAANAGQFTSAQMSGENHPFHKLTVSDVREMRHLRKLGWKLLPIAERFSLSLTTTSKIVRGELWRSVTD